MHQLPRTLTIITLSAAAMFLPACTTTPDTQAHADEPCPLRARLDEQGSLTSAQVVPLHHSPEGRQQLARFAEEYDTVYYDGHHRYAQIVRTNSGYADGHTPVLTFYFGWQHPDYTYPRRIMFLENTIDDEFDLDFQPDSIHVRLTAQDQQMHEYTINWNPQEMAPWGYIFTQTDRIMLND